MTPPPLIGSYCPPAVRPRQRVWCKYRRAWCRITSITDAPIPWARVALIGLRGGSGVWVNTELVRAIKTESAEAMAHWFGVSSTTVWAWRKAFGVGGFTKTRGTREAHHRASLAGGAKVRDEPLPAERVEQMRVYAKKVGRKLPVRWTPERGGWTAEQLAMLGTEPDEVIAAKIGRTAHAVRLKRGLLGIGK